MWFANNFLKVPVKQLYQERKLPVEPKSPGPECSVRSHQLRLAQLSREKVHWAVRRYFQKTVCKPQVVIQPRKIHEQYALSTEFWKVKEMNGTPSVKWRIVRTAKADTPKSKRCSLCLCEKFEIANYPIYRRKFQLLFHNPDGKT